MGWSSGTDIFDGALDTFLSFVPEGMRQKVVERFYLVFDQTDWDTEQESKYFDEYLNPIMKKLGRIDDDWNC